LQDYKDKVAIVTGGGSGMGRALCEELGRLGARVVVADIDPERARETASGIPGAQARVVDVSRREDVQGLVDQTVAGHGQLDYMFNNAGIPGIGGKSLDIGVEQWERMMNVNLMGVVYGTLSALRVMADRGSGHIINTSSLAGLIGVAVAPPYTAAKHGVVGLSMSMRAEAEAFGVRMSVVCPGLVRTGIFDAVEVIGADKEKVLKLIFGSRKRMMSPERAARIIIKGVEDNRAIIIFPFLARFIWWLYRLCPNIFAPLSRKLVRDFIKLAEQYKGDNI
jgi:NAD(P)-dependent dehydrogenase (short-subunit alcohol dehydrogenase family)